MPKSRSYSDPEHGSNGEKEYRSPYSNTGRANTFTYPSYAPTQATRSSRGYENQFSLSDRTLVDDHYSPLETRSWRSGSTTDRRDPVVPTSRSQESTGYSRNNATSSQPIEDNSNTLNRRKKTKKRKDMVYIDRLTISANGPPLETHLRNTKGNVHIKHLRIEDETAVSPTHSSHRRSRRRRSRPRQAEKETESVSKLTRVCELATVAALVLQWKEYKTYKNEILNERAALSDNTSLGS